MNIPVGDETLFSFNYADDQVILEQEAFDLEFMIRILYQEYDKWGLRVSLSKTEYLVSNSDPQFQILISDSFQINQVNCFKYLGALIDKNGLGESEIDKEFNSVRKS